ncbi:hypothetical protein D9613_006819 [Agrocybe pediades]|uniref:Uncharacterized protein n=1 Tax=Agrocybe pediades TaxID=84607 RepID=A0A8H4VJW6_9AGAR|nr:hypothetical protein D9613_006819 [Agrocybe pediades]
MYLFVMLTHCSNAFQEPAPAVVPSAPPERGRGRGRGRGDGRGRGRGRGVAPPVIEMTASGPFAMGPAMAGNSSRKTAISSTFVPSVPSDNARTTGANLSQSAPPLLRKDLTSKNSQVKEEDEEVYSDPDEGVEIIDMENVRQMDWMAPESLRKERQPVKKVKKEEEMEDIKTGEVDASNALNLSESEDEDELEDIIEDFATQANVDTDDSMREERLYFFQFPSPFPVFSVKPDAAMVVDSVTGAESGKKVTFAPNVKLDPAPAPEASTPSSMPVETEPTAIDGVIGQLEVYRSGAVKIRLSNGILLDVNAATQPSFLQQAVYLDRTSKKMSVIGEVNKQFVASPNVDVLLSALEEEEANAVKIKGEETLLQIDQ